MAHILIVEDYPVTQRVLSLQLRKAGHEVMTAANGFEALDRLSTAVPDLAIIDIAMPEMDGMTLLAKMREDARYRSVPVIMLTASGQDQDRIHAREMGALAFLNKPASTHELLATVNAALS